jgi:iron complex outermembrane receptor protein
VAVRSFNDDASALQGILGLVDGRQVNNEFFGGVVWEILPVSLEDVDRIEVIRGPGSFVHGPNAMHGVVNIVTRSPMKYREDEVRVSGAAGSYRSTQSTLTYVRREETSAFKARAAWDDMTEFDSPHRNARDKAFAEARVEKWFDGAAVHALDVTAGINEQKFDTLISQFAGVPAVEFFNTVQESYGKANYRRGDFRIQSTWTHFLAVAEPEQIYTPFEVQCDMADLDAQLSLEVIDGHTTTAGAGYRYASFDTDIDDEGQAGLAWVFAQDQFTLGEALFVTWGGRLDWHSVAGPATSPRLAAVWEFEPGHSLRGTAGYGFRNPSLRELYFDMPLSVAPGVTPVVQGNRDLEAEKMRSAELAYRWREKDAPTRAEAIAYYNLIDRVVEFQPTAYYPSPPFPPGTPSAIEPRNAARYEAYGLELEAEHEFGKAISVFGGYAFGIRVDRETHEKGKDAPRHKATGGVRLSLWGDLATKLWVNYFDDVEFRDAVTGTSTGAVDEYVLLSGRISLVVLKGDTRGTVFLQAFNMLDHDHREHPAGDSYGAIVTAGAEVSW